MLVTVFQFISLLALVILTLGFKAPFGKKFVYKYESQVATGVVDKLISQAAGFSLKASVAVQWQLERESVYFKLSDVKFAEFNKQTTDSVFKRWNFPEQTVSPEIAEYIKDLEEPFWISAGPKDTVNIEHGNRWEKTANFKLSLAALFQIIVRRDSDTYIEMEEGITGRCPVIYRLTKGSDDLDTHDRSLNITKVVLYDKCESRQHRLRFSISGYKCNQCDELTQPLESFGKTNYQIRVSRMDDGSDSMNFEKIDASGAIIFTPFGPDGNTVLSLTNQTLTLVSATDEEDELPSDFIAEPAVGFVFPQKRADSNVLLEAERKLTSMIKVFADFDTQAISIMEFVLLFQHFTFSQFDYFFTRHVNFNINNSTVREGEIRIALLQALSAAGTEASVQYVMHLTIEKNVSRHLAAELIRIVPFHLHKLSHQFLANFSSFTHSYNINQFKDVLQEAVWLSLGTIIKKTCYAQSIPSIQTEKLDFARLKECNFCVESLISDFYLNTDLKQQQLILRAIQNTNLPVVTHFSLAILKSQMHYSLKRTAFWGVMTLSDKTRKLEVVSTVLQIAFNETEIFLLRLHAFEALFYLKPTPELFAQIVDYMSKETNQQISSYVYSTLVTMANASDPCTQSLTKLAKEALRFVKPRRYDTLKYSKNKVLSYYNDKYKFGRTFQFAYIASNESIFPREIYLGQSLKLFGHSFNFQDMIFHSSDADSHLSRHFDIFSTPDENNDFLNKAYKLLPKKTRENAREIPAFILKQFGQDISSTAPFGSDGAHCLYERNESSEDEESARQDVLMRCIKFSFMEAELTVANDMGFLTTLQLHVPFVYKMGFRGLSNVSTLKLKAGGDFHFKFGSNFMAKTSLFVETPLKRKYGYSLETHAGIKLSVVLNSAMLENMEFGTEKKSFLSFLYYPTKGVYPTANPYKLLFYNTSPRTFAHTNVLKYPADGNEQPRHYSYGHNYFGVGLAINYSSNALWPDFMSYSHFQSLFHKGTSQNDYSEWPDKLFAGLMGLHDYLVLNPIGKPFDFSVNYKHVNTDHFAVDTRLTRHVKLHGNSLKVTKEIYANVREERDVTSKWLFQCKSISVQNSDTLVVEFDHTSPNNQSLFAIRLELNRETPDYIQILIDPVSNPDKVVWRFYNGSIKAGSTSETHNWLKMEITGVGSQSNAFKVDESILNNCKHDRDKGFEYSFVCWLLKKQRGRLHNFNFAVRHEASENVRLKFLRYSIWLLHHFDDNLEVELNPTSGDSNQTLVNFNFSNSSPHVDVSISRSEETYKLSNIFIPAFIPHFEHITVVNSGTERLLENALYVHQSKCIISGDYIQTTDRIVYQFPMGPCYHVVFADCRSKRVIVLMNQSTKNTKGLKVFFDSTHEIDIDNNMVKINGAEELKDKLSYIHADNSTSRGTFTVTKHLNLVDIDGSRHFGARISFDGKNAVITVTNWLRGLQCGLCGNFDGEKSNEFIRSDGMQTANATDFARSYELSEEKCI